MPEARDDNYTSDMFDPAWRFGANVLDNDVASKDGGNHVISVRSDDTQTTATDVGSSQTEFSTAKGGTVWINADGSFTYEPAARHVGEDSFQYQTADNDGSPSEWATITLDVPLPEQLIHGGSANADLAGLDGSADVFQWHLADLAPSGNTGPVSNTISHFNAAEGDKLDLRDLLQDGSDNFLFNTDHLSVTNSGSNTVINVQPVDSSAPHLEITVEGVDLTGGYNGQDAIDHLLKSGTLIDDK